MFTILFEKASKVQFDHLTKQTIQEHGIVFYSWIHAHSGFNNKWIIYDMGCERSRCFLSLQMTRDTKKFESKPKVAKF